MPISAYSEDQKRLLRTSMFIALDAKQFPGLFQDYLFSFPGPFASQET